MDDYKLLGTLRVVGGRLQTFGNIKGAGVDDYKLLETLRMAEWTITLF